MKIYNGRNSFYQWDCNQKVTGDDLNVGDELHFCNASMNEVLVTKAYNLDGKVVADVPNILLQQRHEIRVYRYVIDEDSQYTIIQYRFVVQPRPKPSDYVYEETEVYSIETVVNNALAKAKESGEFDSFSCIVGKGNPTSATSAVVGSLYMNSDTGDVYKCTAVSGSTYTWELLPSREWVEKYVPKVATKNLMTLTFQNATINSGGYHPKTSGVNDAASPDYIEVTGGETYAFSWVAKTSSGNVYVHEYDADKTEIKTTAKPLGATRFALTLDSTCKYIRIHFYAWVTTPWEDVVPDNFQMELGAEATEYVSPKIIDPSTVDYSPAVDAVNDAFRAELDTSKLSSIPFKPVYDKYVEHYINLAPKCTALTGFSVSDAIRIPKGVDKVYFYNLGVNKYINAIAFGDTDNPTTATLVGGFVRTDDNGDISSVEIPSGVTYLYTCMENRMSTGIEKYYFVVDTVRVSEDVAHLKNKGDEDIRQNNIKLQLPEKFDLVVGDNFELFYKGILNAINPDRFDFEISFNSGNYGYGYKRKYMWTPTTSNVGQHIMTIRVRDDNGDIIDEGSTILNVVNAPTTPVEKKVVLCVGDSLTVSGTWVAEFYRRLVASDGDPVGYGLTNIQFIGENTKGGAGFVSFGGGSFDDYNDENVNGKVYHIKGTFNKTDNDQHSVYADAKGNTWKLETITSADIKIMLVNGTPHGLPASGTLTHVSGGVNTGNITYSSTELGGGNPFWNTDTGKVDFGWYAEKKGASQISHCYVLFGWNNSYDTETDFKVQARIFLDNLLSAYPNCKISLLGIQVPSRDGLGQNYGVSWKYYEKLQHVWNIAKWYTDIANEEAYVGTVEFVNVSGQFDTDHNMFSSATKVNNRNTLTEERQTNGVHPNDNGYLQIADAALRNFVTKI